MRRHTGPQVQISALTPCRLFCKGKRAYYVPPTGSRKLSGQQTRATANKTIRNKFTPLRA